MDINKVFKTVYEYGLEIPSFRIAHDNTRIILANQVVAIWNMVSLEKSIKHFCYDSLPEIRRTVYSINSTCISSDESKIATSGDNIIIWEEHSDSYKPICQLKSMMTGYHYLYFSPDDKQIISRCSKTLYPDTIDVWGIEIWDIETGNLLSEMEHPQTIKNMCIYKHPYKLSKLM